MRTKGLVLSSPPPGLRDFAMVLGAGAVPVRRLYRPGPVLDQGDTQMCVAYSATGLLNAEPVVQDLDPVRIYRRAKENDGLEGTEGTTVYAGAKALEHFRRTSKSHFAYRADAVYEYLATISPVLVGMQWSINMESADRDGRVRPGGFSTGGHCTLAYGVDYEEKRVHMQNSWGTDWGLHGRFWMKFDDFEAVFGDGGVAAAARETRD